MLVLKLQLVTSTCTGDYAATSKCYYASDIAHVLLESICGSHGGENKKTSPDMQLTFPRCLIHPTSESISRQILRAARMLQASGRNVHVRHSFFEEQSTLSLCT